MAKPYTLLEAVHTARRHALDGIAHRVCSGTHFFYHSPCNRLYSFADSFKNGHQQVAGTLGTLC